MIRKLQPDDMDEVSKIIDMHWDDAFGTHLKTKFSDYLCKKLDNDSFVVFVLGKNKILGFTSARDCPENMKQFCKQDGYCAELYATAVVEKRKGYGSELARFRSEYLKKRGYA